MKTELKELFSRNPTDKAKSFAQHFGDSKWLAKLAYLKDIFSRLNEVNLSLQANSVSIIDFADKLKSFRMKLVLWNEKIISGRYEIFDSMSESFTLLQREEITDISELVQNHLVSLHNQLGMYFPDLDDLDYRLIRNPFEVDPRSLSEGSQDEFVELLNDSTAKDMFEVSSLQKFWSSMVKSYPAVSKKCVESLLLFPPLTVVSKVFQACA